MCEFKHRDNANIRKKNERSYDSDLNCASLTLEIIQCY